jgi:hypothetical protein
MTRSRIIAGASTVLIATAFTLLFTTGPAAAALSCVEHGSDTACTGYSGGSWPSIVCDREYDALAVYGVFELSSGATVTLRDSNGAKNSCASTTIASKPSRFRVCEDRPIVSDSCSSWVRPG